jgi:acetyl-CoA synthetase
MAQRGLRPPQALARVLNPASVAIVGATPRPGAFGERVLHNLAGYRGRIHLVNARYDRIGERPCHASLAALPEAPDCVVLTVAREAVEAVVAEAIALRIGGEPAGGVIVFASGYGETGKPDRAAQQARLAAMAQAGGLPLIGPNCIGIANYATGARVTFMPQNETPAPAGKSIGVVSQSGALGFALAQAVERGVPIGHVLTSGNSCDVDMADYVAHLAEDPSCGAIALLFEGMAEPLRLMAAAEHARAMGKPVVACKLAVGQAGAAAALSHTGSLAGADAAYAAAFARAGVVMVERFEALIETACFFAKAPPPAASLQPGWGVAVIATSGGAAIMAADQAEAHGVALPQPAPEAAAVLAERIPEFGSPRNPCDVTAQVLNDPDSLPACAHALLGDPAIGALVVPSVYATTSAAARIPQYGEWARAHGKPVVNVWLAESLPPEMARAMEAEPSVPAMRSMATAFAAIAAWKHRAARAARGVPHVGSVETKDAATRLLASAAGPVLSEREAKAVLHLYGIGVVDEALARDADAAAALAARFGYPVVLKVESPDLPHKSEAGVIRLDLRDEAAVREAYATITARAQAAAARIDGVLVQRMVPGGLEMLIGGRVDPLFGPLVVVGLGGVLVELLADRAVALAPLCHGEAVGLLRGLKGAALLGGFRGSAPVDIDRLADAICAAGAFLADHAESVAELDINPLICHGGTIVAVDALIVRR